METDKQTVFTTVAGGQCVIEDFGAASVDGLPPPEYFARFGARVAIIWPCIFVAKTKDIPMDYPVPMAVPITFLDTYNPEQFEVVGKTHHGKLESGRETYQHVIVSTLCRR